MISFNDCYVKCQTISGDTTNATLTQFKQDLNIGYKRFDAAIGRYFTRKQQFTNIVSGQQYYQTPVDSIRVSKISTVVSSGFELPLIQIRSETEWREKNIVSISSSYITHYFVYGATQIGLWPKPAATVTNGLRFVYQPQDVDLTKADYTIGTVSITNNTKAVTGTSTVWTSTTHKGMLLSVTDGSDGNWYEVDSVASNTSLTLITPYAGPTVNSATYKLGQCFIFPGEYADVPVDYAMARYYESKNNPARAKYHRDNYQAMVIDAVSKYSSSSLSNVITDEGNEIIQNPWMWPPTAG